MEILKAENIDKTYNNSLIDKIHLEKKNTVLRGISLEVGEGDSICIMGKSGCGKTTLLKILGTIDKATHGDIFYNGINIRKYSDVEMSELRRKNIGFVFQDYNLFDSLSVEENIIVPMILEHTSAAEMRRRLNENAELLGIKGILKKYPYEISGGEKQRTAIARALVNNPQIILADEPTGNLDTVSAKIIMEYFAEINYQKKKAVVIVTHDPVVASYAKKIFFIKDGKIIKQIENTSKQQESIHIISNTMLLKLRT